MSTNPITHQSYTLPTSKAATLNEGSATSGFHSPRASMDQFWPRKARDPTVKSQDNLGSGLANFFNDGLPPPKESGLAQKKRLLTPGLKDERVSRVQCLSPPVREEPRAERKKVVAPPVSQTRPVGKAKPTIKTNTHTPFN